MTKDTHIASGLALTLALTQPQNFKSLAICLTTATIGSVISDIDVTTSESRRDLNKILLISVVAVVVCILLEFIFKLGIFSMLQSQTNLLRILCGLGLFLIVCCFGITTPHRSFMHSALCVIALSGIIWLAFPTAVLPFSIAMLSHIVLDFFNTKKIQFFYPLKKPRIAFKLCHADGKANKIICKVATAIFILEIIVFAIFQIVSFAKTF
jgi:inner membrane protein